jgi:hypothetical protein
MVPEYTYTPEFYLWSQQEVRKIVVKEGTSDSDTHVDLQ